MTISEAHPYQTQAIAIVESGLSHQGLSKKGYKLTRLKRPEIRGRVVSQSPIKKGRFTYSSLA